MLNGNIQSSLPGPGNPLEDFTDLFCSSHLRIERIVSHGHHSPPDFWYDQEETEWVILMEGEATMEFQNPAEIRKLVSYTFPDETPHSVHLFSGHLACCLGEKALSGIIET